MRSPDEPAAPAAGSSASDLRTTTAAFTTGIGALLYALAFVQPWFRTPIGVEPRLVARGQDSFVFGVVPLVLLLSAGLVLALPALPYRITPPTRLGPVRGPRSAVLGAAIGAALVVLRLALPVQPLPGGSPSPLEAGPWLYLAAITSVVVAVAAAIVAGAQRFGEEPSPPAPAARSAPLTDHVP